MIVDHLTKNHPVHCQEECDVEQQENQLGEFQAVIDLKLQTDIVMIYLVVAQNVHIVIDLIFDVLLEALPDLLHDLAHVK